MTQEAIETILADFRTWLQDARAAALSNDMLTERPGEAVDLHTLLGQFLALRHEVNLQTKAVRNQQEQNAEALRLLAQTVQSLKQIPPAAELARQHGDRHQGDDERLRGLLKTLVDISDALALAEREVRRVRHLVLPDLEQQDNAKETAPPRCSFWTRVFGRREEPERAAEETPAAAPLGERARGALGALLSGYTMSLQRIERALQQHDVEPILCVGELFDPESMEVVEVVTGTDRAPGEVVDEVRRGYLWRGRVFRYAQVRVAKEER